MKQWRYFFANNDMSLNGKCDANMALNWGRFEKLEIRSQEGWTVLWTLKLAFASSYIDDTFLSKSFSYRIQYFLSYLGIQYLVFYYSDAFKKIPGCSYFAIGIKIKDEPFVSTLIRDLRSCPLCYNNKHIIQLLSNYPLSNCYDFIIC